MYIFIPVIILLIISCFFIIINKKYDKSKTTRKKVLDNVLAPVISCNKKCVKEIYFLLKNGCGKPLMIDKIFAALNKYAVSGADNYFYSVLLCDVYELTSNSAAEPL